MAKGHAHGLRSVLCVTVALVRDSVCVTILHHLFYPSLSSRTVLGVATRLDHKDL